MCERARASYAVGDINTHMNLIFVICLFLFFYLLFAIMKGKYHVIMRQNPQKLNFGIKLDTRHIHYGFVHSQGK